MDAIVQAKGYPVWIAEKGRNGDPSIAIQNSNDMIMKMIMITFNWENKSVKR